MCVNLAHANLLKIAPETVEAQAWSIVDAQSGQIIAEHNSHVQRAPASLTKMMVAYIALKEIKANEVKTFNMGTTNKISRIVAWTFLTKKEQEDRVASRLK